MVLLLIYVAIALGFSFFCSVAEAVLLSVTQPHIALLEKQGKASGALLRRLKENINDPLAAILTLNTIAHTMGAAGAGAQAAAVFGDQYLGLASAVLTLLILIFSEIIPKTLGATYWRQLTPFIAHSVRWLVTFLYPFVWLSRRITQGMTAGEEKQSVSRHELAVMAELGAREGELGPNETRILKNLFVLRETPIRSIMTPRSVVFSLNDTLTVDEYFSRHDGVRFSRIPVYRGHPDAISGFVLRSDLLLAQARGNVGNRLQTYARDLTALSADRDVLSAYEHMLESRAQIMLAVDEFGTMMGVVTLEDILETLLGLEIVDEGDKTPDMQELARRLWKRRAREMGLQIDE